MENGTEARGWRKSLRNANINYRNGWFFVTCQAARNKSVFGAIVGEQCVLNEFGRTVEEYWTGLSAKYPELEIIGHVLMPNHFHALVRIHYRPTNREHHLGFLMGRFKGGTGYIYGKYKAAGKVEDIGDHLWQFDYWDDLVTDESEKENMLRYMRDNPRNWSRDRYGECTKFMYGNEELLNARRVAFVASQGFWASELKPRRISPPNLPAEAGRPDTDAGRSDTDAGRSDTDAGRPDTDATHGNIGVHGNIGAAGFSPQDPQNPQNPQNPPQSSRYENCVIISTFTSAQEREALRRALARGRRVVAVFPGGIPAPEFLPSGLAAAVQEGRALCLSPQPTGSTLNKKVATWCNEYVLRHADEIWVGDISPNGMLSSMLRVFAPEHHPL